MKKYAVIKWPVKCSASEVIEITDDYDEATKLAEEATGKYGVYHYIVKVVAVVETTGIYPTELKTLDK